MRRILAFTLSVILAIVLASCAGTRPKHLDKKPLCVGDDCSKEYLWLTNAKVREYEAMERFLTGGGTAAIVKAATTAGCFDRIKIVGGKEVKECWSAVRPAGKDSKWECQELSRREKPECYEAER
ncbi:MAG: hypothetical protein M1377_04040 [Deltaproteobacteria bacterium]|nr:hypothetical protein [Deltaproteobacteria bacterium]